MVTARIKASDRTKACQQVVAVLKKQYGSRPPVLDHDVLETLLFAICLENASFEQAQGALQRLRENFFDYNEVRVSSITELLPVFEDMNQPEVRAMKVRDVLQVVFEGRYSYELEDLKKKNLEAAEKYLNKIQSLTPFIIGHTLLSVMGSHLVPVDEQMCAASIWLGLLEEETDPVQAADQFKAAVRKSDVPLFYFLLNSLASDPQFQLHFAQPNPAKPDNPLDALNASHTQTKKLLAGEVATVKPKSSKPVPAETTAKKAEKATTKSPTKSASKKVAPKSEKEKSVTKTPPKKANTKTAGKSTTKKKTKSSKK